MQIKTHYLFIFRDIKNTLLSDIRVGTRVSVLGVPKKQIFVI